jgi:multiple sugar transport system substrate-binding protein
MSANRLTRREFLRAAGLAGVGLAAAACAPKATPVPATMPPPTAPAEEVPTAPAATAPPSEGAKITFWFYWSGIWGDACEAAADAFMEREPGIQVEKSSTEGWERVLAAYAANTPPDVLLEFSGSQLMPRGQVLALDDLIAASTVIRRDNYYTPMIDSFRWEGVQYGLPAAEAGVDLALIINKGRAAEAGLDLANPPQTVSEVLDWAEKMTLVDENGIITQLGFDPRDGTSGQGFYNWASAYGKNWWDAETQTFHWDVLADALRWQADWIQKYGAASFEAFRSGFGGWLEPDSSVALGKQAMHINGYWTPGELFHKAAEGQEFFYTWAPVPDARKGVHYQTSLPTGIFLPVPADAPEAAFKLVEFICSDEGNEIFFNNAGGFAWTKSWLAKVDTSKYPGLDFYVKSIAEADEFYCNVQSCPLGWEFPQQQYDKAIDAVIYDNADPAEVLAQAQKACEEELAKLLRG